MNRSSLPQTPAAKEPGRSPRPRILFKSTRPTATRPARRWRHAYQRQGNGDAFAYLIPNHLFIM